MQMHFCQFCFKHLKTSAILWYMEQYINTRKIFLLIIIIMIFIVNHQPHVFMRPHAGVWDLGYCIVNRNVFVAPSTKSWHEMSDHNFIHFFFDQNFKQFCSGKLLVWLLVFNIFLCIVYILLRRTGVLETRSKCRCYLWGRWVLVHSLVQCP